MADTNNHITEAAKLSQEAYKAAKKDISQTLTGMSGNTRKIFNAAVAKAAHDVNYKGEKAMAEAVQALASQGIYASAHYDKNGKLYRVPADVAVRQAVYTSGRQRFNGQVKDIALKTGKDLIEVNSTANCRPSHEAINGKIFSLSGSDPRYPKMTSDLEALFHDYNCGHQWAIYHEGLERVFEDPLEGTGYTVEEARAAVGKQRRYENSIRKQKRVVEALKAAGQETADANRRLSALQRRLREHIEANKAVCRRERHREQLYDTARRMKKKARKAARKAETLAAKVARVDGGNASKKTIDKVNLQVLKQHIQKKTGAFNGALNDKNDPNLIRREKHAERYYAAVRDRNRRAEITAVAASSGISEEEVTEAYEHLFIDKHKLDGTMRYFDPSYDIAVSWQRLREGKDVKPHDITLIKHEALERGLMARGMDYDQAHKEAEKSYNYSKEVNEFNARRDDGLR